MSLTRAWRLEAHEWRYIKKEEAEFFMTRAQSTLSTLLQPKHIDTRDTAALGARRPALGGGDNQSPRSRDVSGD
jgi:hypothetical protein